MAETWTAFSTVVVMQYCCNFIATTGTEMYVSLVSQVRPRGYAKNVLADDIEKTMCFRKTAAAMFEELQVKALKLSFIYLSLILLSAQHT